MKRKRLSICLTVDPADPLLIRGPLSDAKRAKVADLARRGLPMAFVTPAGGLCATYLDIAQVTFADVAFSAKAEPLAIQLRAYLPIPD